MDHAGLRAGDEGSPPAPITSVSVIIPALNEEDAIGRVLGDLPSGVAGEVIVVDGGSRDRTPEMAWTLGARVIVEERRGYGSACLAGLAAVNCPDVVVFLDGDYSDRPAELPALLAPIAAGEADLVIGSRLAGAREPGAMGWHSVLRNRAPLVPGRRTSRGAGARAAVGAGARAASLGR